MGCYPQPEIHLLEMLILQVSTLPWASPTRWSVCVESQDQGDMDLEAAPQRDSVLLFATNAEAEL